MIENAFKKIRHFLDTYKKKVFENTTLIKIHFRKHFLACEKHNEVLQKHYKTQNA